MTIGSIVAWVALAVTIVTGLLANARAHGSMKRQVDQNTERLSAVEKSIQTLAEAIQPLAVRVGTHEDRIRETELQEANQRAAVAEAKRDVAVLLEQNRWIRDSLARIEKRMDNAGR